MNLEIITGTGYTVYDKEQGIAYVQVARGPDNMTLHGMELMIDFDGTTYKTTLRAPNPSGDKSYFFDMSSMKDAGKLPGMVSVAPIFILDARQILGQITSKVTMPIMSIAKNKVEIIAELKEKNEPIINLTVENFTQSNLCGTTVGEDPWGGCPIASGQLSKVTAQLGKNFAYIKEDVGSWTGKKVKFKYLGEGTSSCILTEDSCVNITNALGGGVDSDDYLSLPATTVLNVSTCQNLNYYYIYDAGKCD